MAFNPIKCAVAVNKVNDRIQGFDPRNVIKDCMWSTLSRGKGGSAFKKCVEKKIKQNVKDISNPAAFATGIWQNIKKKCS